MWQPVGECERANKNAVPLYRKLGYEPVREGSMTAPGGIGLPVVFMEKTATG